MDGFVNVVSYHVGNNRKTLLNPVFCDKGPDVIKGGKSLRIKSQLF